MTSSNSLRSVLPFVLFAVAAGGAAWACFGDRGVLTNRSLEYEELARAERLGERRATVALLRGQIQQMESEPRLQERWIREELGYVKPGEVLYLFPGDRAADFTFVEDKRLLASGGHQP
ncbi:MAG: hypothetical protein CL928_14665 [Deltaproteobacteria bacterium]|nr:hypothetical protein [Deltaproteobacteria bacterium]